MSDLNSNGFTENSVENFLIHGTKLMVAEFFSYWNFTNFIPTFDNKIFLCFFLDPIWIDYSHLFDQVLHHSQCCRYVLYKHILFWLFSHFLTSLYPTGMVKSLLIGNLIEHSSNHASVESVKILAKVCNHFSHPTLFSRIFYSTDVLPLPHIFSV